MRLLLLLKVKRRPRRLILMMRGALRVIIITPSTRVVAVSSRGHDWGNLMKLEIFERRVCGSVGSIIYAARSSFFTLSSLYRVSYWSMGVQLKLHAAAAIIRRRRRWQPKAKNQEKRQELVVGWVQNRS